MLCTTAVCFAQSTDSNVNLIQKYPHRHTQNKVWVPCDLGKLTHKINHQGYNKPSGNSEPSWGLRTGGKGRYLKLKVSTFPFETIFWGFLKDRLV